MVYKNIHQVIAAQKDLVTPPFCLFPPVHFSIITIDGYLWIRAINIRQ